MRSVSRLEREAAHLNEEDFKKIFPQEYYRKYAPQQQIRQFQQQLLHETKNTPPQELAKKKSTSQLANPVAPTKLSMFDTTSDVILKNKGQTKRMQGFVKDINNKLRYGPSANSSKIRTPLTGFNAIPEGVFDRLKLLEDAQYEAEMQYMREKKSKAKEFVSFVHRGNNSLSASKLDIKIQGSIKGDSVESKSIRDYNLSNSMLHPLQPTSKIYLQQSLDNKDSLPYEQRVRQIVEKTKSHILLLNPEKKHTDVQCIIAMNRSIRKINGLDHQRANRRRINSLSNPADRVRSTTHSGGSPLKKRKDLIALTQTVRAEVDNLELMSHFDTVMAQRSLRLRLEQIN